MKRMIYLLVLPVFCIAGKINFVYENPFLYENKADLEDVFLQNLKKLFDFSKDDGYVLVRQFHQEMKKGLELEKSSLLMSRSFLNKISAVSPGVFLALDLGGTNFRIVAISIDSSQKITILNKKSYVLDSKIIKSTGDLFFDDLALKIKQFLIESHLEDEAIELGFTFSFPIKQENAKSGILLNWTKEFAIDDVIGKDVVVCLEQALERQSIDNIQIKALVTDGVATLIAKSFENSLCNISVIIGTGTDACYVEAIENISNVSFSEKSMIIDTGWGNFDKLSRNLYDDILDASSNNPFKQKVEKLISGKYIGELYRIVLCDLIGKQYLLSPKDLNSFMISHMINAEDLSYIENDHSEDLKEIEQFLLKFGIKDSDYASRKKMQ
ncbi:MAG TPA: hypothetical protein P5048_05175, partial [Chlamydiales bacterium]|nr:hypothetical protein [Chlamydiales bacterium]